MKNNGLTEAAQDVLMQGMDLLFALNERSYAQTAGSPFNASLGQHYRHVLDHFLCLIKGLPAGEINYDERAREARLENDLTYARLATSDVLQALQRIPAQEMDAGCKVLYSVAYSNSAITRLDSNVARELAFCIGHAIHHYAIIRLSCESMGIALPSQFGVAPATLKHMAAMAAE